MSDRRLAIVLLMIVSSGVSACAARPRTRPLQTTPIAEGPTTMEAARQAAWAGEARATRFLADTTEALADAQERLYAADSFSVLMVQARKELGVT